MDADMIRSFYYADPFRPFGLRLSDGSVVEVLQPWYIAFVPDGKTLDVALADGGWKLVKIDEVKEVVMLEGAGGSSR